jgi:phospholipase C
MTRPTRRDLLKLGAGAAMVPASIRRALALPAERRAGTIEDVQHIVVLMQENRSFDHYLGHLSGVRGVGDPHPVRRANGLPVWCQDRLDPSSGLVMPFRLQTRTTSAECVLDLDHSWRKTHAALNAGRNDRWPAHKTDMTMGYYTRDDLPFHYALADAFTVCDQYFCSTPTQTHPNRFYLMTGCVDGAGTGGGPLLDNVDWVDRAFYKTVPAPFTWTTYPERLEAAGISWQVYQQGLSVTDHMDGNFGTNVLANFRQFVDAPEGSSLARRGMSKRTLDDLRADVVSGALPQVSWLLPPGAFSEHPRWTPGYGAAYISRVLDALTANPAVWAKTVLLVTYDENDGYFDHVPPPQPPTPALPGLSTVTTDGEVHDRAPSRDATSLPPDGLPYGLGPRVATIAISPWSTGGAVCSEVFDHTSIIRFIERRFGVHEPNISTWRRAVCGDLTSAFDFAHARPRSVPLPDPAALMQASDLSCKLPTPGLPAVSHADDLGRQEPGTRPARPLPYDLAVDAIDAPDGSLTLVFASHGPTAAHFLVFREDHDEIPRRYTVAAGGTLQDRWILQGDGPHLLTVSGPNGFLRRFRRGAGPAIQVRTRHDRDGTLTLSLPADRTIPVVLRDNAYGRPDITLPPGRLSHTIDLSASGHWYDVSLLPNGEPIGGARLAGHVETGRLGITDPAIGVPVTEAGLIL